MGPGSPVPSESRSPIPSPLDPIALGEHGRPLYIGLGRHGSLPRLKLFPFPPNRQKAPSLFFPSRPGRPGEPVFFQRPSFPPLQLGHHDKPTHAEQHQGISIPLAYHLFPFFLTHFLSPAL